MDITDGWKPEAFVMRRLRLGQNLRGIPPLWITWWENRRPQKCIGFFFLEEVMWRKGLDTSLGMIRYKIGWKRVIIPSFFCIPITSFRAHIVTEQRVQKGQLRLQILSAQLQIYWIAVHLSTQLNILSCCFVFICSLKNILLKVWTLVKCDCSGLLKDRVAIFLVFLETILTCQYAPWNSFCFLYSILLLESC